MLDQSGPGKVERRTSKNNNFTIVEAEAEAVISKQDLNTTNSY